MILRTDFAPTVWRGTDGLTVQVRGYSDVKPRAGVTLRLLADNNEILGETTTDADGFGPLRRAAAAWRRSGAPRVRSRCWGATTTPCSTSAARRSTCRIAG